MRNSLPTEQSVFAWADFSLKMMQKSSERAFFALSYSRYHGGPLKLRFCPQPTPRILMNLSLSIGPIMSLIAGILILLIPRLLNYIVAIYLIIMGVVGLFGTGSLRF